VASRDFRPFNLISAMAECTEELAVQDSVARCLKGVIHSRPFFSMENFDMRDTWYADKRDLIKWGVLLRLAESYDVVRILQVAYYRPGLCGKLKIDDQEQDIPEAVIAHFRNLRTVASIASKVRVTVFDPVFEDRATYQQAVLALLPAYEQERCIVFLDPDTGLQPHSRPSLDHVLNSEAAAIWKAMKSCDVFALYQHQTNRTGQPWIENKASLLAAALGIPPEAIKKASGPTIAPDVVLYYTHKT